MKLNKKIVIAIDGVSSSGKGTFAKQIADMLNYVFVDSGAMYRATSLYALQNSLIRNKIIDTEKLISQLPNIEIHFEKSNGKVCTFLNNTNVEDRIRGIEVSGIVSDISKIKEVRRYLVSLQQKLGKEKGIVMDGRDIGTVVFPDADIKIYLTASNEVRAQRRFKELTNKGLKVSIDEIRQNIENRDRIDLNREESPLRKAADAQELDNSNMNLDEQMTWFVDLLKRKGYLA